MKAWLLRLHRWVALIFALPLVFVLGTGLILSVEPWVVASSIRPNTVTPASVEKLLGQHDPSGKARMLAYRSYDNSMMISAGRRSGTLVDAATGEVRPGPSALASVFMTSRQIHERLMLDLGWVVVASTIAMLALSVLGVLMGWPRFANSVSGWHKAIAWCLLPLVVASPLTGLMMYWGVTFAGPPPAAAPRGAPMTLPEAAKMVAKDHDLSSLVWLRPRGSQVLARLVENGEYIVYTVTRDGLTPVPRNWPRLWHEGNFAGMWSSLINLVTSIALIGLFVTGLWIWARRQLRRRRPRAVVGPVDKAALA